MLRMITKQFTFLFVCWLLLFSSPGYSLDRTLLNDKYDRAFEKYTELYLPGVDWKLLKAQCHTESNLRPDVDSPVGAQGICQFMPGTWNEVQGQLNIHGNAYDAEINIQFAAYYMHRLRRNWTSKRPEWDRHSLALASYNAGFGNILNAQKECEMPVLYYDIVSCLPCVTGHHSKETFGYVEKTWNSFKTLSLL